MQLLLSPCLECQDNRGYGCPSVPENYFNLPNRTQAAVGRFKLEDKFCKRNRIMQICLRMKPQACSTLNHRRSRGPGGDVM